MSPLRKQAALAGIVAAGALAGASPAGAQECKCEPAGPYEQGLDRAIQGAQPKSLLLPAVQRQRAAEGSAVGTVFTSLLLPAVQ
jgi:hypothetical protein